MESNQEILDKIRDGIYKPSKKSARSIVWNCLYEIQKDDGSKIKGIVYCVSCRKILKYLSQQTSNLIRHKCVRAHPEDGASLQLNIEDKNACFEVFMDFTIEDCRPFSIVEGSGFRKMIKKCIQMGARYGENIDLDSLIPSAETLSQKCELMAEEKKQEMKPHLQKLIINGEAAVTIDMWSDNFIKKSFLCATLHYHVDFKLVDITLGMKSMDFVCNTSVNIWKTLNSLFEEFGVIDYSNTVFVTDRRSNILSALKDTRITRLNCSAHLFSNVLNDAFDDTDELKEIISACNQIVRYFKKGNMQNLLDTTLKSHYPTRWNSNFAMFKWILDNYAKIYKILSDDPETQSMLNFSTSVLQSLVEIYNDFDTIFKKLQSSQSPTLCFVIPSITKVKAICSPQYIEQAAISALKLNILEHLDKWSSNLNMLHKAALFLYPPAISLQLNELHDIKEFCITKLIEMGDTSSVEGNPASATNKSAMSSPLHEAHQRLSPNLSTSSTTDIPAPATASVGFFFPTLTTPIKNDTKPNLDTGRYEVERYCNENVILTDDFNIMLWWKNNANKFPKLSKLAIKIMTIPASCTASENVFSLAGNIISEKRNQLEPKTVESVLFLNSLAEKDVS